MDLIIELRSQHLIFKLKDDKDNMEVQLAKVKQPK